MNFNEIKELIEMVNKSNLTDLKIKDKDFQLKIRTKKYFKNAGKNVMAPQMVSMPQAVSVPVAVPSPKPAAQQSGTSDGQEASQEAAKSKNLVEIKSPIVGTFYRSAGADKPLFAKVGDQIAQGDVVCIIEAMKLFNEIESDTAGTIVKVLVEDASPVEYDQVLFLVEV